MFTVSVNLLLSSPRLHGYSAYLARTLQTSPSTAIGELQKQVSFYLNQCIAGEKISEKVPRRLIQESLSILPKGYKTASKVPFLPVRKNTTIGTYLFESIRALGLSTHDASACKEPFHLIVTGIPGGLSVAGLSALFDTPGIEFIRVNNEPGGAFIADFAARFSHTPAINFNTYGAGTTATTGQIYTAWLEHSPLIVLSGIPGDRECQPHMAHHHCDYRDIQYEIFKPITIAQARLDDPATAAHEIFWLMWFLTKYQLPVYIELPRDMVNKPVVPPSFPPSPSPDILDISQMDELSKEIENTVNQSNRPMIMAGLQILRCPHLQGLLVRLAERFNIPVVTSFDGKSAFPEDHRLFLGNLAGAYSSSPRTHDLVRECDLILKIGVIETDVNYGLGTLTLPENSIEMNIWHIKVGEKMATNIYLSDLMEHLLKRDNIISKNHLMEFSGVTEQGGVHNENTFNPISEIFSIISKFVDHNTIVLTDVGDTNFAGVTIPVLSANAYQTSAINFMMGSVIPGAIAAKKIHPEKKVVAIMGDGAFRMVSQELEIAVTEKIPFVLVVVNNGSYRTIHLLHEHNSNLLPRETNLARVGNAWGVKSTRISYMESTPQQFIQEFHEVFKHAFEFIQEDTIPWMIEILVPEEEQSPQLTRLGRELKKQARPENTG